MRWRLLLKMLILMLIRAYMLCYATRVTRRWRYYWRGDDITMLRARVLVVTRDISYADSAREVMREDTLPMMERVARC